MRVIGSPSARRREHIRGKWEYNVDLNNGRERTIHVVKQFIGTPIPWLMLLLPVFLSTSRAASEITSWGLAFLILTYIASDSFARNREFQFFRIGPDLALAACFGMGLLSIISSQTLATNFSDSGTAQLNSVELVLEGLGQLRWVPLLYLFVYAWELFPGLNRAVVTLTLAVTSIAIVTWVQHFQGVDWLNGENLLRAPSGSAEFFVPNGFFGSTEALATLLACVLPFPFAAACLRREGDETDRLHWIGIALGIFIAVALTFTYRPEFLWAGLAGIVALLFFPGDRRFRIVLSMIAGIGVLAFSIVSLGNFLSPKPTDTSKENVSAWASILQEQGIREEKHRAQMNALVKVWETSPVFGVAGGLDGVQAKSGAPAQAESVNVYFLLLARGGLIGLIAYLVFVMHHLMNTLRLFHEMPESHHRHRILVAGCFASQCAFHVAGLFWGTMAEAISMNLFLLVGSISLYMAEHYELGLVPDDNAL